MKAPTHALTFILFVLFGYSLNAQTCTSSGGDDDPFLDDDYPRFRCGTAMAKLIKIPADYKLIEKCDNYWTDGEYYKNHDKIYFSKTYGEFNLVKDADVKSFRCEEGTAKDDYHIYFMGKTVNNVDNKNFKSVGLSYCADDNNVFYRNRYNESEKLLKVTTAHASSFQLIGEPLSGYAKDDEKVYYNGQALDGADPATFELLQYGYSHDKNQAYYNGQLIDGMQGTNFQVLKDCYLGSDGIHLCNGLMFLPGSDAKSFHIIECGYYKDDNHVYLNGAILEQFDSKTFEVLGWGYTKDINAVYCDLKLIEGADPASFEVLGRKHSRDSKHIYYLQNMMKCDYKSFQLDDKRDYLSKDKNHEYSRGIQID